ncbi:MAG: cupin domain-containing protein [Hyphomicrobium sp.]
MSPKKWERADLASSGGPKGRWFTKPSPDGWTDPIIIEWELTGESWTDCHVHNEYAYILEGQLFVECNGVTVEANRGDVVCVPGGATGRYWAPKYARMLGIYGPNPTGVPIANAVFKRLENP